MNCDLGNNKNCYYVWNVYCKRIMSAASDVLHNQVMLTVILQLKTQKSFISGHIFI